MQGLKSRGLLTVIIFYLLITICLIIYNDVIYINVINPLFWSAIFSYLIWQMRSFYVRLSKNNRKYLIYIVVISCIHVLFYFYIGFIMGFVKSPYQHSFWAILKNSVIQILPVISMEVVRGVMISRNKENKVLIVGITIILILLEINYHEIIRLFFSKKELFQYVCSTILPLIPCNILYTYLTVKGSCLLSIIYRLFSEFILILLPILPDIDWFVTGSACILLPTITGIIFKYCFIKEKKKDVMDKISYGISIGLLIILICFVIGAFQYEPIAILSNSMKPTFSRGDVIVYKKVSDNELNQIPTGTIIVYNIESQNIAHRVVDIVKKDNKVFYRTKGDSNNAPDIKLVQTNQIKGIVVCNISYIGFPSVWLYEYFYRSEVK